MRKRVTALCPVTEVLRRLYHYIYQNGSNSSGKLEFDTTEPDVTLGKLVDIMTLNTLGWKATTLLKDGLKLACADFMLGRLRAA
jgi:nucleoside-diphosphate-sugar epimerase